MCVALVMAKSRVVPSSKQSQTVARLELNAGLTSVNVTALIKEELDIEISSETYYTDSMICLGYIQNESKRFRSYVANRTRKIRNMSEREQWRYIGTNENPADDASRGLDVTNELKVKRWFTGPPLLWCKDLPNDDPVHVEIADDDPEVIRDVKSNSTSVSAQNHPFCGNVLDLLKTRVSSWQRMKFIVARILKLFTEYKINGNSDRVSSTL